LGRSENEDKRRQKNGQTWVFPKLRFLSNLLEKSTHSLFGAWSFFLVHIGFTPCEGPKGFVNCFFEKLDHAWKLEHQVGSWKKAILHGLTS
jgi:hypothetical protein